MMSDGRKKLAEFEDGDDRWTVMRCSTPATSWIELNGIAIPDRIAWRIAETIMGNVELPLSGAITKDFTIGSDAMRVLTKVREDDLLGLMIVLRDIYRSRERSGAVIGQLATIALSSLAEVLDDTGIDQLIAGWLQDSDDFVDIDDALIARILDSETRDE